MDPTTILQDVMNIVFSNIDFCENDVAKIECVSRECRDIVREHWKTFYVNIEYNTREQKQHLFLIPGFCSKCKAFTNSRNIFSEKKPYVCERCLVRKTCVIEYRSCKKLLGKHIDILKNIPYIIIDEKEYYNSNLIYGYKKYIKLLEL